MNSVKSLSMHPNISFYGLNTDTKTQSKNRSSHAGLCTGIAASGIPILLSLSGDRILKRLELPIQKTKYSKYFALPLKILTYIGIGAFMDKKINDKNDEFINKTKGKTTQEALAADKRGRTTKKGNPYYNSNTGKKYGALIGAVTLPLLRMISARNIGGLKFNAIVVSIGMIGGAMLGAVTDKYANKTAAKNADRANKLNTKKLN